MENGETKESTEGCVITSLQNLKLNQNSHDRKPILNSIAFPLRSQFSSKNQIKTPPSLLSLCLGVIGVYLEDIIDDLSEIALTLPSDIKLVLVAIARRRKLLNDDVLASLVDSSWLTLDISGSNVSDSGLTHVANICQNLRAVDVSRCSKLTSIGVGELLQCCHSLEILRWGGCLRSENVARRCLGLLKPNLNDVDGESWEDLDASDLTQGAQSLRWLVWPKIDKDSLETLTTECPRITVNPKLSSSLSFRTSEVPQEALAEFVLDHPIVKDIDPKTWQVTAFTPRGSYVQKGENPNELSVAEKFRLAFVERDERLAPKRAKNERQRQRRADREKVMMNSRLKALSLASKASKHVNL